MNINYYFDPLCPWCWLTSRWVISIKDELDLKIDWRPISLKFKNNEQYSEPFNQEPYISAFSYSTNALEIVELLKKEGHADRIEEFYTAVSTSFLRDNVMIEDGFNIETFLAEKLGALGLKPDYASRVNDPELTELVKQSTQHAVDAVGEDCGTPIIEIVNQDSSVALFGPVISELPKGKEESLKLWDAFVTLASYPDFWEIKRTRTKDPNLSDSF